MRTIPEVKKRPCTLTPPNPSEIFWSGKFKATLGLYISFNGYSNESLQTESPSVKAMILMDGQDIMYILDGKIDLPDLLYRKRRHAAETGNIYLKVTEII